jgi:hypothetical protein
MYPFLSLLSFALLHIQVSSSIFGTTAEQLALGPTCQNKEGLIQSLQSLLSEQDSFCRVEIRRTSSLQNNNDTVTRESPTAVKPSYPDNYPWDYSPECVTHPLSLTEYCIYTITQRRNLTLFTTPTTASLIADTPGFYTRSRQAKLPVANLTFERGDLLQISTPELIMDEEVLDLFEELEESSTLFQTLQAASVVKFDLINIKSHSVRTEIRGSWHRILVPESEVRTQ